MGSLPTRYPLSSRPVAGRGDQVLRGPQSIGLHDDVGAERIYATRILRSYERAGRLKELNLPVLFTAGRYDEATPSSDQVTEVWCRVFAWKYLSTVPSHDARRTGCIRASDP